MGLGDNIRALRTMAGKTNAAEFARAIKVSPGTLGDWEKGRYTNLRLDSLLKLAKELKCSIEDLIGGVDADYDKVSSDLIRQGSEVQGALTKGESIESTAARHIASLERELAECKTRLRQMQDAARSFARVVAGGEGDAATGTTPRPRRRR